MLFVPSARLPAVLPLWMSVPAVLAAPIARDPPAFTCTVPLAPVIPLAAVSSPPEAMTLPVLLMTGLTVPNPFVLPLLLKLVALNVPPRIASAPALVNEPLVVNVLLVPICTTPGALLVKLPAVVKSRPFCIVKLPGFVAVALVLKLASASVPVSLRNKLELAPSRTIVAAFVTMFAFASRMVALPAPASTWNVPPVNVLVTPLKLVSGPDNVRVPA